MILEMTTKDFKWVPDKAELQALPDVPTKKTQIPNKQEIKTRHSTENNIALVSQLQAQETNVANGIYVNPVQNVQGLQPVNVNLLSFQQHKTQSFNKSFTKEQLESVDIPRTIRNEIRGSKIRASFFFICGILLLGVAGFFLAMRYAPDTTSGFHGIIPDSVHLPVVISVFLGIVGACSLVWAIIKSINLQVGVHSYKASLYNEDEETEVPWFIKKHYFGLTSISISINYICGWIMLLGGIAIGVLWGLTSISEFSHSFIESCNDGKVVAYCIEGITLFIWLFTLFSSKYHRDKLQSFFNGRVAYMDEIQAYKKSLRWRWWVFNIIALFVLCFVFIVVYRLIRKRKVFALPHPKFLQPVA